MMFLKNKYLLGAVLMASVWTGCSQDDSLHFAKDDNSVFTGSIETQGSRTSLDGNNISWVIGDELSFFKGNNYNRRYRVSALNHGTATFVPVSYMQPDETIEFEGNYAVYPYSSDNSITATGTISAPVPAGYTYESRSSFISSALMASTSTGTNFSFKNVQGYLRLRLCAEIPEDYAMVKSVTLTSSSMNLSGTAEIAWDNDGIPVTTIKDDSDAGKSLTVTLNTPQSLPSVASGDYVEFYVPVVPMEFPAKDVELKITFTDGETYAKKNCNLLTIVRREVTGMKFTVTMDDEFIGDIENPEEKN
jgi:hypothetical protein